MTTLVVGDIHGCSVEFSDLLALVRPREVHLLGDLFTRGPDPLGVWGLVKQWKASCILGNHEARLLEPREDDAVARELAARLDRCAPDWRPWAENLPLWREVGGYTLVHGGLHPSGDLEQTTRRMALSLRRWPANDENARFWHDDYEGERRVIFGHDALEGLVWKTRGGRPHLVGLDSGVVYGGALTGFLVEEGVLVQVPARRQWFDPWSEGG